MDAPEKLSRLHVREMNKNRYATQDYLDRVADYLSGKIKDDRITCGECANNKGRCVAIGNKGFYQPTLKQRCFTFLKK